MARNNKRRHYRVAEKETKQYTASRNCICLPKEKIVSYSLLAGIFVILVFIKGLLLGYLAGKN